MKIPYKAILQDTVITAMCVPHRSIAVTHGANGRLMVDMQDLLDQCCTLNSLGCKDCRARGHTGELSRHFELESANGLVCFVLPKSVENELLDVDGRPLEPNLQTALRVNLGTIELHLRILHFVTRATTMGISTVQLVTTVKFHPDGIL